MLSAFVSTVDNFGLPSRVRMDRGGENVQVATYNSASSGHVSPWVGSS